MYTARHRRFNFPRSNGVISSIASLSFSFDHDGSGRGPVLLAPPRPFPLFLFFFFFLFGFVLCFRKARAENKVKEKDEKFSRIYRLLAAKSDALFSFPLPRLLCPVFIIFVLFHRWLFRSNLRYSLGFFVFFLFFGLNSTFVSPWFILFLLRFATSDDV